MSFTPAADGQLVATPFGTAPYTVSRAITLGPERRRTRPVAGDGGEWWERQNARGDREKRPSAGRDGEPGARPVESQYVTTPEGDAEAYAAEQLVAKGIARQVGDHFVLAQTRCAGDN